jgi:hypothetical protein
LTGNWNLVGNRSVAQYPLLSAAIVVSGDQVTTQGDLQTACSNRSGGVGGSFQLIGQINADGAFQLSETPAGAQFNSIQLSITGTAPLTGTNTWAGTYTYTDLSGYTNCLVDQTNPLTAAALAPFSGTYLGSLTSQSSSITLSLTVSQGAATSVPNSPGPYLPLTGTITVTGTPCFTSGTLSTTSISQIGGDQFTLAFSMTDGSLALVNGEFASPAESSLTQVSFAVIGGQCNGSTYTGSLTQQ